MPIATLAVGADIAQGQAPLQVPVIVDGQHDAWNRLEKARLGSVWLCKSGERLLPVRLSVPTPAAASTLTPAAALLSARATAPPSRWMVSVKRVPLHATWIGFEVQVQETAGAVPLSALPPGHRHQGAGLMSAEKPSDPAYDSTLRQRNGQATEPVSSEPPATEPRGFLDSRTGYRQLLRHLLDEPVRGGASFAYASACCSCSCCATRPYWCSADGVLCAFSGRMHGLPWPIFRIKRSWGALSAACTPPEPA